MKKTIILIFIGLLFVVAACHKNAAPRGPKYSKADLSAGQVIYETNCVKCHKAKPVENYTPEKWTTILKAMVPKAKLDSVQAMQVTAYVNKNAKKA